MVKVCARCPVRYCSLVDFFTSYSLFHKSKLCFCVVLLLRFSKEGFRNGMLRICMAMICELQGIGIESRQFVDEQFQHSCSMKPSPCLKLKFLNYSKCRSCSRSLHLSLPVSRSERPLEGQSISQYVFFIVLGGRVAC